MSLQRVMLFCCLAVSTLSAGWCDASAGDGAGTQFCLQSCGLTAGEAESMPLAEGVDGALERIGRAMLDAKGFAPAASGVCASDVRTLPAAPAAVMMTLVGFLCVSFARDRRAWLGLACGLIWLGQAGTAAAPQLMRRMCSRAIEEAAQTCGCVCPMVSDEAPVCSEGVRYAALLRKLAGIPGRDFGRTVDAAQAESSVRAAIVFVSALCPGYGVRDIVCFSPAFIFGTLSRSPPMCS